MRIELAEKSWSGPAARTSASSLPFRAHGRIVALRRQRLGRGKKPVVGKDALQFGDRGSREARVQIPPREVVLADVHAADEGDGTVENDKLAVIAQVQEPALAEGIRGGKPAHLAARRAQRRKRARREAEATDRIKQQPHLDAAGRRAGQRVREPLADSVILPNEEFEMHMAPRGVDGLAELLKEFLALGNQLEPVAGAEAAAGDAEQALRELRQARCLDGGKRRGVVPGGGIFPPSQPLALHPLRAECQVDKSDRRSERAAAPKATRAPKAGCACAGARAGSARGPPARSPRRSTTKRTQARAAGKS